MQTYQSADGKMHMAVRPKIVEKDDTIGQSEMLNQKKKA